jgi:hypothetical protein
LIFDFYITHFFDNRNRPLFQSQGGIFFLVLLAPRQIASSRLLLFIHRNWEPGDKARARPHAHMRA